jgi:hypothetical protein
MLPGFGLVVALRFLESASLAKPQAEFQSPPRQTQRGDFPHIWLVLAHTKGSPAIGMSPCSRGFLQPRDASTRYVAIPTVSERERYVQRFLCAVCPMSPVLLRTCRGNSGISLMGRPMQPLASEIAEE